MVIRDLDINMMILEILNQGAIFFVIVTFVLGSNKHLTSPSPTSIAAFCLLMVLKL
jgi:hypothetical protein